VGKNLITESMRALSPLRNGVAFLILERAAHDHDEVDKRPDAESTQGKEHQQAGPDLTDIESMNA
jgi:hypothetical protein